MLFGFKLVTFDIVDRRGIVTGIELTIQDGTVVEVKAYLSNTTSSLIYNPEDVIEKLLGFGLARILAGEAYGKFKADHSLKVFFRDEVPQVIKRKYRDLRSGRFIGRLSTRNASETTEPPAIEDGRVNLPARFLDEETARNTKIIVCDFGGTLVPVDDIGVIPIDDFLYNCLVVIGLLLACDPELNIYIISKRRVEEPIRQILELFPSLSDLFSLGGFHVRSVILGDKDECVRQILREKGLPEDTVVAIGDREDIDRPMALDRGHFVKVYPHTRGEQPTALDVLNYILAAKEHSQFDRRIDEQRRAASDSSALAQPNTYPMDVPEKDHREAIQRYGDNRIITNIEKIDGFVIPERANFADGQREIFIDLLQALQHLLGRALPTWRLVITTNRRLTQGKVAAVNLGRKISRDFPDNTVFIHPYFFSLSSIRQLEILYHELVSHILNQESNEQIAMQDTNNFIAPIRARRIILNPAEYILGRMYFHLPYQRVSAERDIKAILSVAGGFLEREDVEALLDDIERVVSEANFGTLGLYDKYLPAMVSIATVLVSRGGYL